MDSYKNSAQYYDQAYAAKADLVDLPFYVDLAKRIGGPVLEIGCGTGRALLPTARAGIQIHGVDNSIPMLQVLRKHLDQEPREVQDRVSISEGDMRSFRLEQKYPLVTIPFRPMQQMYTIEDQAAALKTAAFDLAKDGILAFDVFYPRFEFLDSGIGQEKLELEWPVPSRPGATVRRFFRKDSIDKIILRGCDFFDFPPFLDAELYCFQRRSDREIEKVTNSQDDNGQVGAREIRQNLTMNARDRMNCSASANSG
jgi:SAM-dependent methyltransferase